MGLFDRLNNLNFDDITKKLNEVSQEAFNQGANLAGTAKNKVKSADIERQLNNAYAELGKKLFASVKDNPSEDIKEIITRINDLNTQAEYYRNEARKERGITLCPNCGAEVTYGTAYCSSCGSAVPQPGVITSVKCPGCGADLPLGTAFCTTCGTNVQNVQPTAVQMPLGQINIAGGAISSAPNIMQPMAAPAAVSPMAAPNTVPPMAAPVTIPPVTAQPTSAPSLSLNKAPETTVNPVSAAPATAQPTAAPALSLNKAPETPAAPVTVPPVTAQPTAAPSISLNKAPETTINPVSAAPVTAQPTAAPSLSLNKAPETTINPVSAAPAAAQPTAAPASQFPNGGPSSIGMDIDTKTIYGDTNAPSAPQGTISLNKQ